MKLISEPLDAAGAWVRLQNGPATVDLCRLPGPHRPGSVIVSSDGTRYLYDHIDELALDGPETVYLLVTEP
jgi:hypothetical protein